MTIRCKNEDGYGNIVYVDYEVDDTFDEDVTDEDIAQALEEIA